MNFQAFDFLSSRANFTPHLSEAVVELITLGLPHVLKVCLGEHKHPHCKIRFPHKFLLFVSINFYGDHETITTFMYIWPLSVFVILQNL